MAELDTIVIPMIAWKHIIMIFLTILDFPISYSQSHPIYMLNKSHKKDRQSIQKNLSFGWIVYSRPMHACT